MSKVEDDKVPKNVQFLVQFEMPNNWSKNKLKKSYNEKVEAIIATTTTTSTPPSTTTVSGDGSGDDIPDRIYDFSVIIENKLMTEIIEYTLVVPESLDAESFVICVGECKFEGFWMMIGKTSLKL